jgi:hypothetical protein
MEGIAPVNGHDVVNEVLIEAVERKATAAMIQKPALRVPRD